MKSNPNHSWCAICFLFTCNTIGSCSGGFRFSLPSNNHTSKAVSCSSKNVECLKVCSPSRMAGSCNRHPSTAQSQASHIGCWWVLGSFGDDTGVQSNDLIMRSASRKFRNKLATSKSCRKSFWNKSETRFFTVKIKRSLEMKAGLLRIGRKDISRWFQVQKSVLPTFHYTGNHGYFHAMS